MPVTEQKKGRQHRPAWVPRTHDWIAPRLALALSLTALVVVGIWLIPTVLPGPEKGQVGIAPATSCPSHGRPAFRCEVNAIRKAHHLVPLKPNLRLVAAARRQADDMVRRDYFAHVSPEGSTVEKRVRAAGYFRGTRSWQIGENLAWASGDATQPALIVRQWMTSPPHRAIILGRNFREGGAGIVAGLPVPGNEAGVTVDLVVGVRR
jgi:cysteine-rich secretory family protein